MFFDLSIQAFQIQVVPEEDHITLQFLSGIPIPGPGGQIAMLPAGAIKVGIGKEAAIEKAKELLEAAEALPDPEPESDIAIAQNVQQAEAMARQAQQMRDGTIPKG